ncbi:MAG: hypothetical protein ABI543_01470 [Ignavibacteria bacterium]
MSTTEIKKVCHLLLDQIEDKKILEEFLEILKDKRDHSSSDFWNDLTDEQKKDLEEAWIESEDENNLISNEEVMKISGEWIKKLSGQARH